MTAPLLLAPIIIALSLTLYLKPRLIELLRISGMVIKNYSGKDVVSAAGIILIIPCALATFPLWEAVGYKDISVYIAMLFAMALAGYLDDSLGGKTTKGFKGHLRGMVEGDFSTGIIKIVLALIMGFMISGIYFSRVRDIILNAILFCLCVNFINLLDLRPGRAAKTFMALVALILLSSGFEGIWITLPILSSLSVYMRGELNEVYMLGDTGSNLMGGILGLYILRTASLQMKYILVLVLGILHIVSEFRSFSEIIESIPILKFIDSFGQLREEES